MTLTDRDRKIVFALVPILVLLAYWFLALSPKREEASTAKSALAKAEKRRDRAQTAADAAKGAQTDFRADYTEIVRLGKAIPAQVDMPSLIVQLNGAAAGTGIRFTKIATGDREATAAAAPAPAPSGGSGNAGTPAAAGGEQAQSGPGQAAESANGAAQTAGQRNSAAEQSGLNPGDAQTSTSSGSGLPVGGGASDATAPAAGAAGPAGLETVPLDLEFVGNFFNLADFFHDVKRFVNVANQTVEVNGRLVTIEGVRFSSDTQIFPRIRAELSATVYLSPKAQGTTAGATPQGPAPATPNTTPAGTTPEAPTAPTAAATP